MSSEINPHIWAINLQQRHQSKHGKRNVPSTNGDGTTVTHEK